LSVTLLQICCRPCSRWF